MVCAIRLVEDARRNDPFTPQMVRRLRRLGLWVLALGLLSSIVEYVAQTVLPMITLPHDETLRLGHDRPLPDAVVAAELDEVI